MVYWVMTVTLTIRLTQLYPLMPTCQDTITTRVLPYWMVTPVTVSRDKGIPINRISWLKSKITDVGMDFSLLNNKLTGTIDYFYRKRTGLLGAKNDVIVPVEIGYFLPQENANSDAQYGEEISLNYDSKIGRCKLQCRW